MSKEKIILASASPRRKELLGIIYDEFDICVSEVEETVPEGLESERQPEYLARLKAMEVAAKYPEAMVIGADTSVLADDTILGKPHSCEEAKEMLNMLSGRVHRVITGCCVIKNGICRSFSVTTKVEFYKLTDNEIEDYINTSEPYDKAGAYGIQAKGALFVKKIDGDYFNVVGLPVAELKKEIDKL